MGHDANNKNASDAEDTATATIHNSEDLSLVLF